jgi:hypothetical protein
MNISAITNQTAINFLQRSMAGGLLAAAIGATTVGLAATSHADPMPSLATPGAANCKTEPWGFLGSQRRTLCDGPITADGSWTRERTFWQPAHFTTRTCSSFGSSRYSSLDCYGGYFVNERLIGDETYPVRPETVLQDEPGHLG